MAPLVASSFALAGVLALTNVISIVPIVIAIAAWVYQLYLDGKVPG